MCKFRFSVCGLLFAACAFFSQNAFSEGLQDDWVRYFEARNVMANMQLAPIAPHDLPHGVPPHAAPQAAPFHNVPDVAMERPECMTRMTCPVCGGKGNVIAQEPDYGQWEGRLNRAGKKDVRRCPLCDGKRGWRAYVEPRQLSAIVAQARNSFMVAHQSRGDFAAGQAFVPRSVRDRTERKHLKLVEEAYGKPCSRCDWSGVEACKKCKGSGVVNCTNNDCKTGWIVTKTVTTSSPGRSHGFSRHHNRSRHTMQHETITVSECPACNGAALLICPDCNGLRANPCSKCHGLGYKQKH